jgi:hypothetical protein
MRLGNMMKGRRTRREIELRDCLVEFSEEGGWVEL